VKDFKNVLAVFLFLLEEGGGSIAAHVGILVIFHYACWLGETE